jgi:RND family efflux transporter MFP subunit
MTTKVKVIKSPLFIRVLIILLIIFLIGAAIRYFSRIKLSHDTEALARLHVTITFAKPNIGYDEVMLPGNLLAWHEATIFARTNGYVINWFADIGKTVKKGEVLALISTPEVDAQLRQAEAQVMVARNNNDLAQITAARWRILVIKGVVSRQDADEKIQTAAAYANTLKSAIENCDRLRQLVNFEQVRAPFDGIVSQRTTDIGTLINAGSATPPSIFHVLQTNRLRLYVSVPQYYTARLVPNLAVKLRFNQFPNRTYASKLIRTARAVEPNSRTLLTEFEINNSNLEILPGSYTQVYLQLPKNKNTLIIPVNTMLFRSEGLLVATVTKQNTVLLKTIRLGRDFGTHLEVISGITTKDKLVVNPPDGVFNGQKVTLTLPSPTSGRGNEVAPASHTSGRGNEVAPASYTSERGNKT